MQILRNLTEDHGGVEGEKKKLQRGREANHNRLLNTENKPRVSGGVVGGGMAKWVRGTKKSTPEIIVSLYAN